MGEINRMGNTEMQNADRLVREKKEKEKDDAYKLQLQESNKKLEEIHRILSTSKMGTWHIELIKDKAPTMEADDLMRELLGIKDQDLSPEEIYDAWFSHIVPSEVPSVLNSVRQMEQGLHSENTYLWEHPALGVRYVRCGGTAEAVPGGYILSGYHYDVDTIVKEQKRQEKILKDTLAMEKQHSEVISSLSTIYSTIFIADLDTHRYTVLNSVPLMGLIAGDGGNFDDVEENILNAFMAPDMRDDMRAFLDFHTLPDRLKNTNTIVTEYRNPQGRWFQARLIVKNRNQSGKVQTVLYVARDFSEEKQQELAQEEALKNALISARQANRAKTSFLSNMSHDIRTPMNAIIGFAALAQAHIENQSLVQDYLKKIHISGSHLLSLINEILDISRIESGNVKLEENVVHIPDVLNDLRTIIQGQIVAKQQNLYIDTLDVKNEDVFTDKLRLNQILLNIVSNAIKYTGPGGDINIRIMEKPCEREGYGTYVFSVRDTGMGMSPEFVGHVFDTFSRESTSTISGIQGTGLGMSITKNIVDMMQGTITVESEPGKGSEFVVTVDFKLAQQAPACTSIPQMQGARVLIVDDDVNSCQSVGRMLRDIEMRPDWSTSGREAVIRAKEAYEFKDEYKAYIIDYMIPDMNGIETVRQIRKVIENDVPIIILTAYDWSDFEEEAREAGVTAFVAKPIFKSELWSVLTNAGESFDGEQNNKGAFDYSGKRVLLVEDNALNREIATTILQDVGFQVDEAVDGTEAVSIMNTADEDRYDLIFMDIQMPKMDGYMATREIRTLQNNKKANIPIVAMTANAFDEDRKKSFEAGMNAHIAKPIDMQTIARTLDKIFGK